MTEAERRSISQGWLQVGESALDAADALYRIGNFRSCVSRAYYAAFAFLASALVRQSGINFREGYEGPEHKPLSDLVANHLGRALSPRDRSPVRLGVRTLYAARVIADYRPREAVNADLAVEGLKIANTIAKAIRSLPEYPQ